jgi:hypothetical protein
VSSGAPSHRPCAAVVTNRRVGARFLRINITEGHFTETTFDRLAGFHYVAATDLNFTGSVFSGRTDFDRVSAVAIDFSDATFGKRAAMLLGQEPAEEAKRRGCVFTGALFDQGLELQLESPASATLGRIHLGASSTVTTRSAGSGTATSRARS